MTPMSKNRALLSAFLLCACGGDDPTPIAIHVAAAERAPIDAFVEFLPYQGAQVIESADPVGAVSGGSGIRVALVADLDCGECYRLEQAGDGYAVHAGGTLGLQYGLAHFLEAMGFGFYHPWRTHVPDEIAAPDTADFDVLHEPEMSMRGLHLHTLHPIEPYFSFWEPSPEHLDDARRTMDWMVKNRANYIQWVALDDIQRDPAIAEAWAAHTDAILADAHLRGLETGLGIQIFGSANLQQAFDLIEEDEPDIDAALRARLPIVLDRDFDLISLSFGEFFGEEPGAFVATVDQTYDVIAELRPDVSVSGTIHVGDSPDQRVDYMGENLIYYFLIKFANENIIPYVHTVMFYNLFEDAGGAYHHDDFAEHRDFLLERLDAGQRAVYHPETAYWVAFDNSVPLYYPLYVRSRWVDVDEIRAAADPAGIGKLDEHVVFSTGWEWGYWQNDWAVLRTSWQAPERWEDLFHDMFAPYGAEGAALAEAVIEVTRTQREYVLGQRLTQYLAGRDFYIDLGDEIDVVSQPDRPTFEEVMAMTEAERATFVTEVLDPLDALATATAAQLEAVEAVGIDDDDPFYREIRDGVAANLARTRFIHALYRATVAHAAGQDATTWLAEAQTELEAGAVIVARRHAEIHYPRPEEIVFPRTNATLYQFGYLEKADKLCYWEREQVQVRRLVEGLDRAVPGCIL